MSAKPAPTSASGSSGHLVVFDTTLRDGEQSPGISLDVAEKLEIAEQLARVGVDYIEAGFPVASQGDFEAVQAIARSVGTGDRRAGHLRPVADAASRTSTAAGMRCATRTAARIHVFISTSPQHMEHMLKMTQAQVLAETRGGVARAREHTDDVEFSPQDATRTPLDFMLEVLRASVEAGATTLNIPDTVGYGIPWDFGALIQHIRKEVPGDYVLSTHCHNDLGLATANTLAGVQAGARQVEVCVNGLGERAGNAALEEVVMALRIRPDQFPGVTTTVRTEELARASRLVARGSRATPSSTTRPWWGATPSPTSPASTSTASWPTVRPTRSSTPPASARWGARSSSASTRGATPSPTRSRRWASTSRATG